MNRKVNAGEYYYRRGPDEPLMPAAPAVPDVVICRRLEDYPPASVPTGGTVATCRDCGRRVLTNLAKYPAAPRVCMQCAQITPLPIP
jgi:hypothetical protein